MNIDDIIESEMTYVEKIPSVDNIIENIYIGNYSAASNKNLLKELGITHILICGKNLEGFFPNDFKYNYIPLYDSEYTKITKYFPESNDFIEEGNSEGKILVHCGSGISRSVALVIAYLISNRQMPFSEVIKLVKERRKIANPNPGFEKQLRNYSFELLKKF